jgi:hypothetical protein
MSYIKPLNGSIGPKQTKCHIVDEQDHFQLDDYISFVTTTKTPDVPSGGVFSVKTRTCLTWAGGNSTRMLVTSTVEWTGKSWVKGIIEKSAIEGQKQYHQDLVNGMRSYMKEHPSEFGRSDEPEIVEKPTEAAMYAAEAKRKRHEDDLGYIQGGLDKVVAGFWSIIAGITAVARALTDMASAGPKEAVFTAIIVVLLISNIYTYVAFQPSDRYAQRIHVTQAVQLLLAQSQNTHDAQGLLSILDNVEKRLEELRRAIEIVPH